MHHLRFPDNHGISRCDSPISALSGNSCLISSLHPVYPKDEESSILSGELLFEHLNDSSSRDKETPSRRHSRRALRTGSEGRRPSPSNRSIGKSSFHTRSSSRHRSTAQVSVIRSFLSFISFTDDSDDEKSQADCFSAVSSLGMTNLNESSDEEDLHGGEDADDASTCCSTKLDQTEESSIVHIKSQILLLRKRSMERFQATTSRCSPKMPCKSDKSPSLPSSLRVRQDSLRDLSLTAPILSDQTLQEERSMSTLTKRSYSDPLTTSVMMNLADNDEIPHHVRRPSSLPCDLSKLMEMDPYSSNGPKSFSGHGLTPLSQTNTTRTDRWCCSAAPMIRDSELARQSFERATLLRKERNDKDTHCVVEKICHHPSCRNNDPKLSKTHHRGNEWLCTYTN
jgi:hypothetical protein